MKKLVLRVVALSAACLGMVFTATPAMAQFFSDGFESYSNGQLLFNVGGWTGWDNAAGAAGTATNAFAHTGNQSILAGPAADAVHPFSAGQFATSTVVIDAWMLLNQADHTGDGYFIVNNQYNHGGPYQWISELQFDVTTGTVLDDLHTHTPVAINYGAWTNIRIEYDMVGNVQTTYYNGALFSTGIVTAGTLFEVANIDLFNTGATIYWDNISVVPEPATGSLIAMALCGMAMYRRKRA